MPRKGQPALLVILVTAVLGLAGCTIASPPAPAPGPTSPAPADEPATFHPDGSAEDNLPYFIETLERFSAGDEPADGEHLVNALADAGFEKTAMQVSFDRSKTDLVADSMYVSVRFGTECLIGQVVTADRSVTTVVDGALGPEQNLCLIGKTRVIDW